MGSQNAHDAKEANLEYLLGLDGVTAVGVREEAIVLGLSIPYDDAGHLPESVDGVPIKLHYSGEVRMETADVADVERTSRHSPIPCGVAIGPATSAVGTSGLVLTDGDRPYLASNNHVIARFNRASPGEAIHHPGRGHGGSRVGTLADYVPLEDGTTVDVAWAEIDESFTTEIHGVGYPSGEVSEPVEGESLTKSGITTGVTSAAVIGTDVSVRIDMRGHNEDLGVLTFHETVETWKLSEPGDSGSPVLNPGGEPVGLVFAGGSRTSYTIKASEIESKTGLSVVTGDRTFSDSRESVPGDEDDPEDSEGDEDDESARERREELEETIDSLEASIGDLEAQRDRLLERNAEKRDALEEVQSIAGSILSTATNALRS